MTHLASILMNDLVMLIEAQEIFSEEEYNTRYDTLIKLITEEGGFE